MPNRDGLPYLDSATPRRATIGYGFNLEDGHVARLVLAQLGLFAGKSDAEVLRIEGDLRAAIRTGHGSTSALEARLDAFALSHGVAGGKFILSTFQGEAIFNQILTGVPAGGLTGIGNSTINVQGKETRLNSILTNSQGQLSVAMNTKEYEALMSLFYNAESLVAKNNNLAMAVINGNRVEAWYEIRYQSNKDGQHSDRRYAESDLFGLYDGVNGQFPATELEARQALAYFHQPNIEANVLRYEGQFKLPPVGAGGIDRYTQPAEGFLIIAFADPLGVPVLHAFAANPNGPAGDPLVGTDTSDLLLGAFSHDILIGGGGDDLLRGEAGKDAYVYNSGDGDDTIFDTDGQGLVVFDHQLLAGGIKKQSEGVYKSLDGQITYQRSGSDLVVNGTLTLKDWQEGQFGHLNSMERLAA